MPPRPGHAADKRRLERLVANLVENAEYHACGSCKGVSGARRAGLAVLIIYVDDAGPGVPARLIAVNASSSGSGAARTTGAASGLGLAIVARHVEWNTTGHLRVKDRPEGGARFIVELPVDGT